jgi:hypothetical protein
MLPVERRAASVAHMATAPAYNAKSHRGWFLTLMTLLFVILAISDFTKPLQHARNPNLGLVLLGHRLVMPAANIVAGILFGIVLLIYAFGIFRMRAWVLPLAIIYAFWVPVNEVMFWSLHSTGEHPTVGFISFYLFLSLGGSIGTALYLAYHRARLT